MTNRITPETADAELVQRAKAGELDAFEMLTTRHEQRVYSLAMRMLRQEQDAEDVTQQTFLSALENLEGFRGEASFSTWLLRIASHAALKVIRKRKGLDTVSLEEATESSEDSDSIPHPEFIADWRQSPEHLVQNGMRFNVCWTRRWPGWTRNIGWFFCCGMWKGFPSGKPPRRST